MTEDSANSAILLPQRKGAITRKRLRIIFGVLLAAVVLPPVIVPFCKPPWSEINCQHQDINIKTGQARYSRYLWYVKISEVIRDTPISVALAGEVIDAADIEPWHRVNTFAMGSGYSPFYRFHGALVQVHDLGRTFEMTELDHEEKREIAENILKLWQTKRGCNPVNDYLRDLLDKGPSTFGQE